MGEIDLESYRAEVDKLRSRWKDWEGALQGDGGKDVELGRQVIKELLSTPVFGPPDRGRGLGVDGGRGGSDAQVGGGSHGFAGAL